MFTIITQHLIGLNSAMVSGIKVSPETVSCGLLLGPKGSCPEMKLYGMNDPPPAGVGVLLSSGEEKLACAALLGLDPGKLYAYSSRGAYMELQAPVDGSPTPGT